MMAEKVKVAILGATGYTGGELLRLLYRHPGAEISYVSSERFAGQPISNVFTHLQALSHLKCEPMHAERAAEAADVVFCALPHVTSMEVVPALLKAGARVIDLSADFRLTSEAVYEEWYGKKHLAAELLKEAVYGLPELYRSDIKQAKLIANPGCYPTSVALALGPLMAKKLIDPKLVIADCKSGVTGAGRSPAQATLYSELSEGFKAYKVEGHRHAPEMEQMLSVWGGEQVSLRFTPHLLPQSRGILSTCYMRSLKGADADELRSVLKDQYQNEPFVEVLDAGLFPTTSDVRGSNFCHIAVAEDKRSGWLMAISVIDNLMKGASGAAVQNFNLMTGWDETTALEMLPLFP
uniref:N-acetyl-gamma-glutamyl-phosphate reductase n=1 Tax=Magnetococcus massalia (strain MO-1) TaxID=451514 RepID=A0A1S7LN45_MAGMO|nr:N-acetyl-gamma-glutamyl-phosphate reductase [Candidatus Magnetococcus massalia]